MYIIVMFIAELSMVASLSTPGVDPSELTQSVTKLSIAELSDTGYESTTDSMTKVNR